ncbi:putative outer membrane starch-binding protein [Larkinella arboricola]|uniref:Putative outer membrane starch-binding protein n=1 Tax=Larkinella arboricola TaxID=643671 RepID=A0A327WN80_LARAB|nr:RagB/SusD family nutrient uptake outer membrane protein [Larkinella arboricola]RAJ93151.1 putative outer membrane starch-binding protein [Larkinella arboricola]
MSILNKWITGLAVSGMLLFSGCANKLEVEPPHSITDKQIAELLASGDEAKIRIVMGGMANAMPLLFNNAGATGAGVADMYYSTQGLDVNRSLEGNDIILGDQEGLNVLSGSIEYQLGDFIGSANAKNGNYWRYGWFCITTANQMLNYLPDETVASNNFLKECKARGLFARAYGYNYLMENYQDAFLQGGKDKLGLPLYDRFQPTQENKPRASAVETYAFIKNDLNRAITLFKEAGIGYTDDITDIDLAVANFLLARVSIWTGDWATAISACNEILAKYPTFLSQAQYGGKNIGTAADPEIRPETNGFLNNAQNPEVILGFPLGAANTYFTAYMNPFGRGNGGLERAYKRIDNRLYEKIAPNDFRKDAFSLAPIGNYTYPPNNTVAFIPSYTNLKFAATHGLNSNNKIDVGASTAFYMRTSEVLLMKAEAEAMSPATEAAAKATLDRLLAARTKAGMTPLTTATYPAMQGLTTLQMVQLQTRIELWGEGGREFYNNKRWNIPVDRASSANHVTKSSLPVANMTLQIPEDEILYNPLAVQN